LTKLHSCEDKIHQTKMCEHIGPFRKMLISPYWMKIFVPSLVQTCNTTTRDAHFTQKRLSWQSKMAAAAVLNFELCQYLWAELIQPR